jgi:hypothetical protein
MPLVRGGHHLAAWLVRGAVLVCAVGTSGCTLLLLGSVLGSSDEDPPAVDTDAEGGTNPTDDPRRVDGSTGSDGAPTPSGCAGLVPAPKLCEDFDRGALSGWSNEAPDGGIAGLSTTESFSAPGSLHVKMTSAPSCSYARIERSITGMGTKRVEVRLRIRPVSPFQGMTPLALTFDPNGSKGCTALVDLDGSGANSSTFVNVQSEVKANDMRALGGRAPNDTWSELVVVATPAAGGGMTLAISLGDALATPDTYTFPQCGLGTELDLYPGFHCSSGTKEAYLDDLRVYTE